ncbi:uncharacterized protein LOC113206008 [Frankliniella occidentalis]|uniref:Uncharacterized protein LOC113206008 n=1 Tax=Frankliniella occidentalis TaxID=133901 RepID=A0A6J1S9C8_FRAOC|nr:uncharacterized protein LOC113206008 [Frankliniella occidentalis]
MAPKRTTKREKILDLSMDQTRGGHGGARGSISHQPSQRLRAGANSRSTTALAVRTPRPHREGQDQDDGDEARGGAASVVPYSSPESGFRGYTFEVGEALKDMRQDREVKGGLMGPLRAVAEFERAQEQRNEAFRLWLSDVMRKEKELAKKAAFTVIKRRDQMLQEVGPDWFQQLSWDQMQTVNALHPAHRADAEEGGAARVALWCGRLGVSPIPSPRQIRRALRQQPEDHEAFLLALYAVISKSGKTPVPGDPPAPKLRTGFEYTPSERLILSALAHLRLPHVIGKLVEQFGEPEKKPRYLRINPEVPGQRARPERYLWPYLEPLPVPQMDWLELFSANHTAYVENLYMRSHKLPSTLIAELQAKPQLRVTIPPQAGRPAVRKRKPKSKDLPSEDLPADTPGDRVAAPVQADDDEGAEAPSRKRGVGARSGGSRGRSAAVSTVRTRTVGSSPLRAPAERPKRPKRPAAKRDGAAGEADDDSPGVDPASVVSFLESLASEEPLCQLPDVHRIPAIQKWVRLRNGLLYVHRRLAEVLEDRSLIMWNANHLGMSYRVPTPRHGLTPKQVRELTWDRREWYRRRVDRIMRGYNTALRTIQVNAAREMFPAMACDYFPGRDKFLKTYFAYMPKHEMDQPVVKPWNPGEYNQSILPRWRDRYYQCRVSK